jgi:hypothetical protein
MRCSVSDPDPVNPNENLNLGRRDPRLLKMLDDSSVIMSSYAKSQRRPGETEEQAFYRLAVERDPTFVEQYRLHVSLRELM